MFQKLKDAVNNVNTQKLKRDAEHIQAITGKNNIPFGQVQCPGLSDYADGINTLQFLAAL